MPTTRCAVHLKTARGYFTVYGWEFRADFNKACALPFPNPLRVSLAAARKWLKEQGIAQVGTEAVIEVNGATGGKPATGRKDTMNSAIRWFVPKRSRTAHAHLANLGNGNVEFWCGMVRDQYAIRLPKQGDAKCKDCRTFIRKGQNRR